MQRNWTKLKLDFPGDLMISNSFNCNRISLSQIQRQLSKKAKEECLWNSLLFWICSVLNIRFSSLEGHICSVPHVMSFTLHSQCLVVISQAFSSTIRRAQNYSDWGHKHVFFIVINIHEVHKRLSAWRSWLHMVVPQTKVEVVSMPRPLLVT